MPQLGETVTEGTITKWFKSVGDQVARDEPLFEVSTDKVDSEVPSPADGVVTAILVEEGDTVDVGVKLAVISDGASRDGQQPAAASNGAAAESATESAAEAGTEAETPATQSTDGVGAAAQTPPPAPRSATPGNQAPAAAG